MKRVDCFLCGHVGPAPHVGYDRDTTRPDGKFDSRLYRCSECKLDQGRNIVGTGQIPPYLGHLHRVMELNSNTREEMSLQKMVLYRNLRESGALAHIPPPFSKADIARIVDGMDYKEMYFEEFTYDSEGFSQLNEAYVKLTVLYDEVRRAVVGDDEISAARDQISRAPDSDMKDLYDWMLVVLVLENGRRR